MLSIARHSKKHDAWIANKRMNNGIKKDPNNVITNLTRFKLIEDEVKVLGFNLKHDGLSRPEN